VRFTQTVVILKLGSENFGGKLFVRVTSSKLNFKDRMTTKPSMIDMLISTFLNAHIAYNVGLLVLSINPSIPEDDNFSNYRSSGNILVILMLF
jgi:hypothetical protein